MRAAVVTPYYPWPADTGGKLRSYHLIKGLAAHFAVDLYTVCYGEPPATTALEKFCRHVQVTSLVPLPHRYRVLQNWFDREPRSVRYFQDTQSLATIRRALADNYDLLICDEISMANYFTDLPDHAQTARIIMRQKIDYLHYQEIAESRPWGTQRLLDLLEARRLHAFEQTMMGRFQGGVVCSKGDAAIAATQGPKLALKVIVNGADVDYFTIDRQPDPQPTLLLLGTMHYQPNIDMVLYFFQTIYPALHQARPDLQVLIVGHLPPPEIQQLGALPGVTVTGSVDDVRPYMARSWLLAVPLRLGGGTRLKIVEALAAGLPVVSTSVGAQGLEAISPDLIALADTPAVFVEQTLTLLQDTVRRSELSVLGRQAVEEQYSWHALGQHYADFCCQLAQAHRQAQGRQGLATP